MKYEISKQLFPFSYFKPPISKKILRLCVPFMRAPKFIFKDKQTVTCRYEIQSYDGESVECFLMSPRDIGDSAPALIYIHGGGFVLPAASYHYKNAMCYAREVGCRVLFVNYRLAPDRPTRFSLKTAMRLCVGCMTARRSWGLTGENRHWRGQRRSSSFVWSMYDGGWVKKVVGN